MRVLFCKIHCPLMCFCKPSAAHIYTSGGLLKLESVSHRVPSTAYAVFGTSSSECAGEEGVNAEHEAHTELKSCVRRRPPPQPEVGKKSVQWMDKLGKELAEIKEFESRDTNNEKKATCVSVSFSDVSHKNTMRIPLSKRMQLKTRGDQGSCVLSVAFIYCFFSFIVASFQCLFDLPSIYIQDSQIHLSYRDEILP